MADIVPGTLRHAKADVPAIGSHTTEHTEAPYELHSSLQLCAPDALQAMNPEEDSRGQVT